MACDLSSDVEVLEGAGVLMGPCGGRRFFVVMALCGIGLGMTAPITVLYAGSLGAGAGVAGLVWAALAVSLLIVDVLGTTIVPRIDGRRMVVGAMTTFGVGALVSAVAPNLAVLIASRMIQGLGAAVFLGGSLQLVVRMAPPTARGRAIGALNAALFAGIATGPLVGGSIATLGSGQFGYRLACFVSAIVCVATAVLARLSLPAIPSPLRPQFSLPRRPRSLPGLRVWPPLVLGMVGQGLRSGVVFIVVPLLGTQHLGLGAASVGVAMSALALVDIVTMRSSGRLADRVGRRPVLVGALVVGAATCALIPWVSGLVGYVVWCAAFGTCTGVAAIVPAAMLLDVTGDTEAAVAALRIASDGGEIVCSVGSGGLVAVLGPDGAVLCLGGLFVVVAVWVARMAESAAHGRRHVLPTPDLEPAVERVPGGPS
jgi:DHA1 family inner membrane transport protein